MKTPLRFGEFVALMALMISLAALSIDAMLPALPDIGRDLGVTRENDNQLVVSMLFLGMAFGQICYGPLSDRIGRKPAIYTGLLIFIAGCVMSIFATDYDVMLIGRVLQGIGVSGPRIVSIALVRDQYSGRAMARVMSFVMSIFIIVPAAAPALGQGVLLVADWRAIFIVFLALALVVLLWFGIRQPETLAPDQRIPISIQRLAASVREIFSNRTVLGYTVAAGLIFGSFLGYLNSAQQMFQDQYAVGSRFAAYFAVLALAIGAASVVNARVVMRFGMRQLTKWALCGLSGTSIVFYFIALVFAGDPALWMAMGYFMLGFFCIGILFGNLNALAMEPLGHVAGLGAAVVGSLSTFIALPLGILVGASYDGTILPLVAGFAVLGSITLALMVWIESAKH